MENVRNRLKQDIMGNIKQELLKWSKEWTEKFNNLSETYHNPYYTQSPLDAIEETVDVLFVGINPGEPKDSIKQPNHYTPEQFLKGNPAWKERFKDGKNVWKFTNGARFFMGYDAQMHQDTIDNDAKVVWTNLSPFSSQNGFSDLPEELTEEGINCFIDLVKRLQPQKVVFLGGDAFKLIDRYAPDDIKQNFEHTTVFDNVPLEIGRIYGRPAYYVSHPSRKWAVSNSFIPVFIFLRDLYDVYENGKPKYKKLNVIKDIMRREMKLWQERIKIED